MPRITFEKVWVNCLEIIKDIVEWQHYKTWFEPIHPVELKVNVLVIQVPSQFFYEYLEEILCKFIGKNFAEDIGKRCETGIPDYGRQWQPAKQTVDDGCSCT